MSKKIEDKEGRRHLLTGMGLAAAGLATGITACAEESTEAAGKPKRYEQEAWLEAPEAHHRVFIDSDTGDGGMWAMRYAGNILNAHGEAYGGSDADYAMIVCFRRMATPFGWGDDIWRKYSVMFDRILKYPDPATGEPFVYNPMNRNDRNDLPRLGNSIDSVVDRGVRFAVCNAATRGISGLIARAADGSADEIYEEIAASIVPNARLVPAGVLTATRAQEYGYGLLSAGGYLP